MQPFDRAAFDAMSKAADRITAAAAGRAPATADVRDAVVEIAMCFKGIGELGVSNRGYWVDRFQRDVGLAPGHPWCMAYVQYVYKRVSTAFVKPDLLPKNSASTQTMARWAEEAKLCVPPDAIGRGDIIVWRDGKSGLGHTGIVVSVIGEGTGRTYVTIEGNTSVGGSRDGGRVLTHSWPESKYGRFYAPSSSRRWVRDVIGVEMLMNAFWKAAP